MAGKTLRKVRRAAVLSFVWDLVRKLETRTQEGDQAGFYKHLKTMNLEGKRDSNSSYVKDGNGVLLTDVELNRERWVRWFHTLLNAKSPRLDPNIAEGLDQWPENIPLEVQPTMQELTDAIHSWRTGRLSDRTRGLRRAVQDHPQRRSRPAPETARYCRSYLEGGRGAAAVERCHHHGTSQKEGSDRVRQPQGHLGGSACRQDTAKDHCSPPHSEYCERVGILPEEQGGFQPKCSTTDMIFMVRRLQELARKKRIPLYECVIDLTKAYDFDDRTLLWTVLARFGVPQIMISVICQFHDGMRVCVRLDDRVCSRWFAVDQGLRQGCVLAPLLFNIFFAAVINLAFTRFKADQGIVNALVQLRKKRGAGGRGEATAGESALATPLWGMLYADDVGVVSQSPEEFRRMMGVIVVVPRRLASRYRGPRLRSFVYARRGCRSPPPHSA